MTKALSAKTVTVSASAAESYSGQAAAQRIVEALGNNVTADLLGTSRSPPSRWRTGKEQPSADSRKRIADLDYVLDRLLLELHPDQVGMWLTSANAHLGGARPVDVLQARGAVGVIPAIDALAAGAFA
jgi:hypothetical protein